ncbi:MAG TPA: OB-fold domain-containing protein [Ilumatobacter sp.]|nr:OB-fold domain-containing protein [Ilumatobacter sp.]
MSSTIDNGFTPPLNEFTRPFWDGIAAGELRLPQCQRCAEWQWYPLDGVPHSCGGELSWTAVPADGTIFTFTTVRHPFLPGAGPADVPLTTVLVELAGAPGVRLVARLATVGANESALIGQRVVGRFVDIDGRRDLRFEPV